MKHFESLKSQLEEIVPVFENAAVLCVKRMLGKIAVVSEPWRVVEHLNGDFTHLATMGSANSEFKSLILAGVSDQSLSQLVDDSDVDMEYLADVLGEFVNSYCAILDDNEIYSDIFGKQIQAVPILYSGGTPFVSFLWGIQGTVKVGEGELYMGYVIQHTISAEESHGN